MSSAAGIAVERTRMRAPARTRCASRRADEQLSDIGRMLPSGGKRPGSREPGRRSYLAGGASCGGAGGFAFFFFIAFFFAEVATFCTPSFFIPWVPTAPPEPLQPLLAFSLAPTAPDDPAQPLAPWTWPGAARLTPATRPARLIPASNCGSFSLAIRSSFPLISAKRIVMAFGMEYINLPT